MKQVGMKLREAFKNHGPLNGLAIFNEAVKEKKIDPYQLSIRGMAEGMIGDGYYQNLVAYQSDPTWRMNLREQSVVDTSNFAAVQGQILLTMIRDKYQLEVQTVNQYFRTVPITNGNLSTEREQIVTRVNDIAMVVNQAMPYPNTIFGQQYVEYPAPVKFGEQCNVTAEMVFADKTKQIYDSAASVGEQTGMFEARAKLRVLLGIVNPYSANGTAANTYNTSGSIINKLTTFAFTDWRSMNTLEQTLLNQTDPSTGYPLQNTIRDVFVIPTRVYDMRRVFNATEVRSTSNAAVDTLISGNPLTDTPNLYTSRYAQQLLINEGGLNLTQASSLVIAGDFRKALLWREVWPVTITQLPPGNLREFDMDIVLSVKASGFGAACVAEPRYLVYGYTA